MNKFSEMKHADFPKRPGCYIVKTSEQVLYVGQSANIFNRMLAHEKKNEIIAKYPSATVDFIFCEMVDLFEEEYRLIEEFRPLLNLMRGRNIVNKRTSDVGTAFSIRLTESDKEIIRIACAHYNMTRSELISYAIRTAATSDGIILPGPTDSKPVPVIEAAK